MARVIIVIDDISDDVVNYQCSCETPEETNSKGEPTLAIRLAAEFVDKFALLSENNEVK